MSGHKIETHFHGNVEDPHKIARMIGSKIDRRNADAFRNLNGNVA